MLLSCDCVIPKECRCCRNKEIEGFLDETFFICKHCEREKFMFFVKHTRSDGVIVQRVEFGFPKWNESPESLINHWNIIGGGHYEYKLLTG